MGYICNSGVIIMDNYWCTITNNNNNDQYIIRHQTIQTHVSYDHNKSISTIKNISFSLWTPFWNDPILQRGVLMDNVNLMQKTDQTEKNNQNSKLLLTKYFWTWILIRTLLTHCDMLLGSMNVDRILVLVVKYLQLNV